MARYDKEALLAILDDRIAAEKAKETERLVQWEQDYKQWRRTSCATLKARIAEHNPHVRIDRHYDHFRFEPPVKPNRAGATCSLAEQERARLLLIPTDKRGAVLLGNKDRILTFIPCHPKEAQ